MATASPELTQGQGTRASGSRYQMLDVWRGLVALLVVLEHVGVVLWSSAGDRGWDSQLCRGLTWLLRLNIGSLLFFVMSGFCIASSLDGARRRGDSPGRFLLRRFWRIFPTYWAALLLFVGFVAASDALGWSFLHQNGVSLELASPATVAWTEWWGNFTLTETWRPHLVVVTGSNVFTRVAWSLCYQEQFYVVCALLLWLVPGRLARWLAYCTVGFVFARVALEDIGRGPRIEGTWLIFWHVFAVGLAVYWRLVASVGVDIRRRRLVEAGLALLAVLSFSGWDSIPTVAPYLFGLALIGLHRWDAAGMGLRCLAPVRACGRRSYSIYLIHLPVTTAGNSLLVMAGLEAPWARALVILPAVTVASLGAGWIFHATVERHFLGLPPAVRFPRFRINRWLPPAPDARGAAAAVAAA